MSVLRISQQKSAVFLTLVGFILALTAFGEENTLSQALDCTALKDDSERLECFDNEASGRQPTEASIPAAPPDETAIPAAPPDESAAALSESSIDDFGMNAKLASQSGGNREPTELSEISATVTDVYQRPYGEYVVTLDNGQVWTEKTHKFGLTIREGDTLIIRKGSFGGYKMVGGGNRSSASVRVR